MLTRPDQIRITSILDRRVTIQRRLRVKAMEATRNEDIRQIHRLHRAAQRLDKAARRMLDAVMTQAA